MKRKIRSKLIKGERKKEKERKTERKKERTIVTTYIIFMSSLKSLVKLQNNFIKDPA